MKADNEVFYFTKDHLGSVRELIGNQGQIVQRYDYTAYGETTVEDHDQSPFNKLIENRYAYTSREIEEEIGDYYYRARYYSPETGRFLSEDPIGFESGDANFYRYVKNNPFKFIDPSGLANYCPSDPEFKYVHQSNGEVKITSGGSTFPNSTSMRVGETLVNEGLEGVVNLTVKEKLDPHNIMLELERISNPDEANRRKDVIQKIIEGFGR